MRPIRLDNLDRVIYNVPAMLPGINLGRVAVLIRDMGAAMRKVTQGFREQAPDLVLAVRRAVDVDAWGSSAPLVNTLTSRGVGRRYHKCVLCNATCEHNESFSYDSFNYATTDCSS